MARRRFTAYYEDGEVIAMFARGGPVHSAFQQWRQSRELEVGDRLKVRELDIDLPEGRHPPFEPLNLRESD